MKTEIAFILDRSGSMASMTSAAIEGFNEFLQGQQQTLDNKGQPMPADFTLILFDNEYLPLYHRAPISTVPPLNHESFQPRGSTALLDAIGRCIDELGATLAALPESERPQKVIIAILTDGEENCSHQYSLSGIHEKITHQKNVYSWDFLFLAANQDAISTATRMGVSEACVANFSAEADDIKHIQKSVSFKISAMRKQASSVDLNEEELGVLQESMEDTLNRVREKK